MKIDVGSLGWNLISRRYDKHRNEIVLVQCKECGRTVSRSLRALRPCQYCHPRQYVRKDMYPEAGKVVIARPTEKTATVKCLLCGETWTQSAATIGRTLCPCCKGRGITADGRIHLYFAGDALMDCTYSNDVQSARAKFERSARYSEWLSVKSDDLVNLSAIGRKQGAAGVIAACLHLGVIFERAVK